MMTHTKPCSWLKISLSLLAGLTILNFSSPALSLEYDQLRHKRYCEILVSKGFTVDIYNTINLNDCPDNLWKPLTVQSIKKDTGAYYVHLSGPRYFVMDGATNTEFSDPIIRDFQGLSTRKVGIIKIGLMDLVFDPKPYEERIIDRQTTWVYAEHGRVYELINPKGEVYVMQSYLESPEQSSEASLETLGERLQLPKGWQFKTGILQQDTDLVASVQQATVIQDNLFNTYQKATHDFLQP